jgi:hypothetical protein
MQSVENNKGVGAIPSGAIKLNLSEVKKDV